MSKHKKSPLKPCLPASLLWKPEHIGMILETFVDLGQLDPVEKSPRGSSTRVFYMTSAGQIKCTVSIGIRFSLSRSRDCGSCVCILDMETGRKLQLHGTVEMVDVHEKQHVIIVKEL